MCQENILTPSTPPAAAAWTVDTRQVVSVDSGCCSQIPNPRHLLPQQNSASSDADIFATLQLSTSDEPRVFFGNTLSQISGDSYGCKSLEISMFEEKLKPARHHAAFKVTEITLLNFWCLTPTLTEALDPSLRGCAAPTWLADVLIVLLLKANEPCISSLICALASCCCSFYRWRDSVQVRFVSRCHCDTTLTCSIAVTFV